MAGSRPPVSVSASEGGNAAQQRKKPQNQENQDQEIHAPAPFPGKFQSQHDEVPGDRFPYHRLPSRAAQVLHKLADGRHRFRGGGTFLTVQFDAIILIC